jgi:hypothetical protein
VNTKRMSTALLLLSGLLPAANAVGVVNGSFESYTGTFGSDGGAIIGSTSSQLPGWTVISQVAILRVPNAYALTASDGTQFLDLTSYFGIGGGAGQGVQQTLSDLTPGEIYTVAFDIGVSNGSCGVSGNICSGPVSVQATVGSLTQAYVHNPTGLGNIWGTYAFDFVATSSTTVLQLTMLSTAGAYVGLDNVTVSLVPEPASTTLFLLGGLGLAAILKRQPMTRRQVEA